MHTSQLCIFLAVLVATLAAADSKHGNQWSRRPHKTVARSKRSANPLIRQQACGPSSNSTSSSTSAVASINATASTACTSNGDPPSAVASTSPATPSDSFTSTSIANSPSAVASTSAAASETSVTATSTSNATSGTLDALFPEGTQHNWWTTSSDPSSASANSSSVLPLSSKTLNATKIEKALSPLIYTTTPDGTLALKATYPEGSYTPSKSPQGGLSFYATGPMDILDVTTAKTLTLGYAVWFEEGFEFNMGGKLPGLYGGNSDDDAVGCSGGHHSDSCYSARFMWRTNGMGELYTYLPPSFTVNNSTKVCQYPPFSTCNPTYGASIGRGSFNFTPGVWNTVSQRVQLNDVGSTDGEIQVWANGNSVIDVSGLVLRNSSDGKHRGMMMQTFFGGSTSDWASPKTQDAYFSDFSVAIIDLL